MEEMKKYKKKMKNIKIMSEAQEKDPYYRMLRDEKEAVTAITDFENSQSAMLTSQTD